MSALVKAQVTSGPALTLNHIRALVREADELGIDGEATLIFGRANGQHERAHWCYFEGDLADAEQRRLIPPELRSTG